MHWLLLIINKVFGLDDSSQRTNNNNSSKVNFQQFIKMFKVVRIISRIRKPEFKSPHRLCTWIINGCRISMNPWLSIFILSFLLNQFFVLIWYSLIVYVQPLFIYRSLFVYLIFELRFHEWYNSCIGAWLPSCYCCCVICWTI